MRQILICGYFGFNNFGDEALLYVLIKNLLEVGFRREEITVVSNNPYVTSQTYNTNSISRWNIIEIFNSILNTQAIIFTGGLFQDKTSFRSFLYYFLYLFFGRIFQKEIVFYGAGLGPLQRKLSYTLLRLGLEKIRLVTVRDNASLSLTPYHGSTNVTCDPLWGVEPDFTFQNQISQVNWQLPILGVALRNNKNLKMNHLNSLADKLIKILTSMKDWQILLVPCMLKEDLPVLYELWDIIQRKVSPQAKIILLENFSQFPIPQQAGILASCDVMISMRYHALLVPLANGKPVFGLVYEEKIKSLLEFSEQIGASPKDDFDQPWSYFWQNLEHLSSLARGVSQRANNLNKRNKELLQQLIQM